MTRDFGNDRESRGRLPRSQEHESRGHVNT
jgi:hypothetical protein